MRVGSSRPCRLCSGTAGVRAFTLIELLTVVAIIALLIGILVPSLGSARDSAKKVKSKAAMKSIGDGLEAFAGENTKELKGNNYPPSKAGDDPTGTGDDFQIFGAQWAVRYLLGKDFKGYAPPTQVPKKYVNATAGEEQIGWYVDPTDAAYPVPSAHDENAIIPRVGPYLATEAVAVKAPKDLNSRANTPADPNDPQETNPVFVDAFDMPILYYAADSKHASSTRINIATTQIPYNDPAVGYKGVYNFGDNALFTGGNVCRPPGTCVQYAVGAGGAREVVQFESGKLGPLKWAATTYVTTPPADTNTWKEDVIEAFPDSFASYILDRGSYDASGEKSIVPVRRDSFILFSPGRDGLFGTKDDIKNWD